MNVIFYDFETTSLSTRGQILTADFIVTDEHFNIKDKRQFKIKTNNLEIPEPESIAITGIDVLAHNSDPAIISEFNFAQSLYDYLSSICKPGDIMAGYNSNKFDLKWLRTLLIKYGFNPYFKGVENKDVYLSVKHLYLSSDNLAFRNKLQQLPEFNMKLSTIYNILHEDATETIKFHDSEEDVLATISIAKVLAEKYATNFLYKHVNDLVVVKKKGAEILQTHYNYSTKKISTRKLVVLDVKKDSYLLADTEDYDMTKPFEKLIYVNKTSEFTGEATGEVYDIAAYAKINLDSYFASYPSRDIEDHIYAVPFDQFPILNNAIVKNDIEKLKENSNRDSIELFVRYWLNNKPFSSYKTNDKSHFCKYFENKYVSAQAMLDKLDKALENSNDENKQALANLEIFIKDKISIYESFKTI